jgi:polyisoprenoid-binding protein YceI
MRFIMAFQLTRRAGALALAVSAALVLPTIGATLPTPIALDSARVTILGTSNVHPYSASTTAVKVTRVQVADIAEGPTVFDVLANPTALQAFDLMIPAASLSSPRDGLDKNMHKALKVETFPDIRFGLTRLEMRPAVGGGYRAAGVLTIAGVSRDVAFDVTTVRDGNSVTVKGETDVVMTDYGITPPKAMLGMLKTDPKVTVRFEVVLSAPLS